jgi:hypothetical protein
MITGQLIYTIKLYDDTYNLYFSSETLFFHEQNRIWIWNTITKKDTMIYKCHQIINIYPSPDSTQVIIHDIYGNLMVIDIELYDTSFEIDDRCGKVRDVCYSPNSEQILCAQNDILILNANTGELINNLSNEININHKHLTKIFYMGNNLILCSSLKIIIYNFKKNKIIHTIYNTENKYYFEHIYPAII